PQKTNDTHPADTLRKNVFNPAKNPQDQTSEGKRANHCRPTSCSFILASPLAQATPIHYTAH
ncbi:MAG: hypothetical protein O3A87_05830, partial [Verrucomicrobia bacterium]|nr:hypothetical protein [Verrucomicrobiota bacterium]